MNKITIKTFGFKYGIPRANYYFDVSFLKNPARQKEWGFFSEVDENMIRFVENQSEAKDFVNFIVPLIIFLSKVDQNQIFAIGCNAGRHRSRIISKMIKKQLEKHGVEVYVKHEDMG